jgi:hypothetical protein
MSVWSFYADCGVVAAQLDLPLLTAEHKKQPHDTRVVFYLAQTLDLVGDIPQALDMYQKRIDMGGWQQEIFEAHMRRVGLLLPCVLRAGPAQQ